MSCLFVEYHVFASDDHSPSVTSLCLSLSQVELASSAEDVPDDGASHLSSDGAEYYGELVQLRAERDHLVRFVASCAGQQALFFSKAVGIPRRAGRQRQESVSRVASGVLHY